jgi:hypothetical protein
MWKSRRATALSRSALVLGAVLFGASTAAAQTTAVVCGKVTDSTAGVMPGVTVTLERDGVTPARTVTRNDGEYLFIDVAAGTYRLSFTLDGFKKTVRIGLLINAGHEFRADQRMEVSPADSYAPPAISASVAYDRPMTAVGTTFTVTRTDGSPVVVRPCGVSR